MYKTCRNAIKDGKIPPDLKLYLIEKTLFVLRIVFMMVGGQHLSGEIL